MYELVDWEELIEYGRDKATRRSTNRLFIDPSELVVVT